MRSSQALIVAIAVLVLTWPGNAGAYEITATLDSAESYIFLSWEDFDQGIFGDTEVDVASQTGTGNVASPDGSTWQSHRTQSLGAVRTRQGDDVITTATLNLLGTFTGNSVTDSMNVVSSEAIGGQYYWNGVKCYSWAQYFFTVNQEPGSTSINPSATIDFTEILTGWDFQNPFLYDRYFAIDQPDGMGGWAPKLEFYDPFPTNTQNTTFDTGVTYRITSYINGANEDGEWGDFTFGVDSTAVIRVSETIPTQVPEPGTLALLATGGLLLALRRRRLRAR